MSKIAFPTDTSDRSAGAAEMNACIETAEARGLAKARAEECDRGEYRCPLCPFCEFRDEPPRLLKAEPVALGAEVLVFVGPEGSPREVVGVVRALRMYQGHMVVRIHSDDDTAHDLWFGRYRLR